MQLLSYHLQGMQSVTILMMERAGGICCVRMCASVRGILTERTNVFLWSEVAKFAF